MSISDFSTAWCCPRSWEGASLCSTWHGWRGLVAALCGSCKLALICRTLFSHFLNTELIVKICLNQSRPMFSQHVHELRKGLEHQLFFSGSPIFSRKKSSYLWGHGGIVVIRPVGGLPMAMGREWVYKSLSIDDHQYWNITHVCPCSEHGIKFRL